MIAFPKPKARTKKSKYGAVKSGDFPSKLEASVYQVLCLRERAGEIRDIKRQATVNLYGRLRWKVDFKFTLVATGEPVWAEAKGVWTRDAKMKLNLWRDGMGLGKLEIWMGHYLSPKLVEVVIPKKWGSKDEGN
jgi:hypothetical protein